MNLKALIEKRNEFLSQADALVAEAEKEIRSFNLEEKSKFDALTKEIKGLDTQIQDVENLRKLGEKVNNKEEIKMDKEREIRGLEQFLRSKTGEEFRELQVSANGGAVIPENVEGTIVAKMEETSPVFAKARKFPSVNGALKIAKETASSAAGFVGETANVVELALSLGEVSLTQKRVGAAITLSNQLINDSAVNLVDYSVNLLSRRAAKAIEKSILLGSAAEEFKGIFGDAEIAVVDTEAALTVAIEDLVGLYNAIHPEFLGNASFIMSRAFFNIVAKLKDNNGHFYVQNGVINGKLTYTLFGAAIDVTDAITSTQYPCLFGSVEDCYGMMVKKGFSLQHIIADTTQALRGSQLLVLDGYMDGAVYNPQAMAKLNVKLV
jgi:HK97 family phage major capsid protein